LHHSALFTERAPPQACPTDIDKANAWNPSDIHLRTYSDNERFSRAIAPDRGPSLPEPRD
jgi:aminomethyltransferase